MPGTFSCSLHPGAFLLSQDLNSPSSSSLISFNSLGLLSYYIPQVEPRDGDFRTVHGAVSVTPPAPTLLSGEPWYPWYSWQQPQERELSRLRRLYQGNLLEESGPPPESMPQVPAAPTAETSAEQMGSQSA